MPSLIVIVPSVILSTVFRLEGRFSTKSLKRTHRGIADTYTPRLIFTLHTYAMGTASSASTISPRSSATLDSSHTSASSDLDPYLLWSTCQAQTTLKARSNAVTFNSGTPGPKQDTHSPKPDAHGPKPDTTRLRAQRRYRALALPEHGRANKDPLLRKALKDAAPKLWGCNVQTAGANGLSEDAVRKRRMLRHMLRAQGGTFNILEAKKKRPALAERPNPPPANPVVTGPGGQPHFPLYGGILASSPWDENGAFVLEASTPLSKSRAPDTTPHRSDPSVVESPPLPLHPRRLSQSDAEFSDHIVGLTQWDLSQSPQDDISLAVGPHTPEEIISISSAPASPPTLGVLAAVECVKSGAGTLFGAAASSAPEAGAPVDLSSAVPVLGEVPEAVELLAENPVGEFELTQEELDRFQNDQEMNFVLEKYEADLQAQAGQQLGEQQLQPIEQLQEGIWASQPAEHEQQQQAAQNLSVQSSQWDWNRQPVLLTGQQGHGQEQQMPLFPTTVPPQQPAHGLCVSMPQQAPLWFDPSRTIEQNILHAPFPPQQFSNCYNSWTNPNCPWDIHIYLNINGQGYWHSVWTGQWRFAATVPTQASVEPVRGPRGGILRRSRLSASASASSGSAPVSLSPDVGSAQGKALLAAGPGSPAPVTMQEQPTEQSLVDPALLAAFDDFDWPEEEVLQPMMSGAL